MNLNAIKKTSVCFWSEEDDCYIADSLIFQRCAGIGDTPEEALAMFERFLNSMYVFYKEGKLSGYDKVGRPTKGGLGMHTRVQPYTKEYIGKLAKKFGISQGEAIDCLVNYHEIAVLPQKPSRKPPRQSRKNLQGETIPILKARNTTRYRRSRAARTKRTARTRR